MERFFQWLFFKVNSKKAIWLLAGGVLAWRLVGRTAATVLSLQFKIADLRISGFGSGTTTLRINLMVKNPAQVAIRLRQLTCWLTIDGKRIGRINQRWAHTVAAGEVVTVPLYIVVVNRALSSVAWENIKNGNFADFVVGFDGKILVDNAWLPVLLEFPGSDFLNIPAAPAETETDQNV